MPNKAETFARSETHINLMRAFAGESQARNRYTIAAGMAREKNLYVVQQAFPVSYTHLTLPTTSRV